VLGVFGLSSSTRSEDLREEFSKYGELEKVDLIIDKRTGLSRCFCFIYYHNVEDAIKAKEHSNGMRLHGRQIRSDFSITQRAHSPTPGQYMGRVTKGRRGGGSGHRSRSRSRERYRDSRDGSYDRYYPRRRSPPRRYDPYYDNYSRGGGGGSYGSSRYDDRY